MAHEPDTVRDFGATPVENVNPSNINDIDALISGTRWIDPSLTYSFTDNELDPDVDFDIGEFEIDYHQSYPDTDPFTPHILASFRPLSVDQQTTAMWWLDQFAAVSGLSFERLEGPVLSYSEDQEATIRIANSGDPRTAYAYLPNADPVGGDVWFGTVGLNPSFGNFDWVTIGHEIGHAIGLEHGHEGAVTLSHEVDSSEYSIMTYRTFVGQPVGPNHENSAVEGHQPQSLMMYDIAAVQYLYGANFETNAGDTRYRFNPFTGEMSVNGVSAGRSTENVVFRTIWDGGGEDTYDFSDYRTSLSIDLTPGRFSDLDVDGNHQRADLDRDDPTDTGTGMARGHVFNALMFQEDERSLIENASGGRGDDTITGNQVGNSLVGHGGNDTIFGGGGIDIIAGAAGADLLFGGAGQDGLFGGGDTDILRGGSGDDFLDAGANTDGGMQYLLGEDGSDTYHYTRATERAFITNQSEADSISDVDTVIFGDLSFADVSFVSSPMPTQPAQGDVLIARWQVGADEGELRVAHGGSRIEEFRFMGDGVTFDRVQFADSEGGVTSGTEKDDLLIGGDATDILFAGPGNDILNSGANQSGEMQYMHGREGSDTYQISKDSHRVFITNHSEAISADDIDRLVFLDLTLEELDFTTYEMPQFPEQGSILGVTWDSGHEGSELRIAHRGSRIEEYEFSDGLIMSTDALFDYIG